MSTDPSAAPPFDAATFQEWLNLYLTDTAPQRVDGDIDAYLAAQAAFDAVEGPYLVAQRALAAAAAKLADDLHAASMAGATVWHPLPDGSLLKIQASDVDPAGFTVTPYAPPPPAPEPGPAPA